MVAADLSSSSAQLALFSQAHASVCHHSSMKGQFTANERSHMWLLIMLIKHLSLNKYQWAIYPQEPESPNQWTIALHYENNERDFQTILNFTVIFWICNKRVCGKWISMTGDYDMNILITTSNKKELSILPAPA